MDRIVFRVMFIIHIMTIVTMTIMIIIIILTTILNDTTYNDTDNCNDDNNKKKKKKTGNIVYEMIIPQWNEIDTPIVICDAQNLSKIICVFSLFELKVCFDEFGHHIK